MPTTVTASDGTVYPLWQLPDLTTPEPSESWTFTEFTNDLSDGYRSRRLVGSDTGVKSWKLKAPTLAGLSVLSKTVTSVDNAQVARLDYIRSLYAENKVNGTLFVFPSPVNGQYYLSEFAGTDLTLDRVKATVQLYSTGIEIRQVRAAGKTIYSPTLTGGGLALQQWNKETGHGAGVWNATGIYGTSLTATGDVVFSANPQNGLNTVRFNGSASTGLVTSPGGQSASDIFIVMKMREATFSNNCGLLTGSAANPLLLGSSGTTKFQNLALPNFEYRLNGVLYPQTNQQAPMNTWGIVHLRSTDALTFISLISAWQIGKDRGTAGTFPKADIAEVIMMAPSSPLAMVDMREVLEYFTVKWGIV